MSEQRAKWAHKTDEQLIAQFHSFPLKRMVAYILVTLVFSIGFLFSEQIILFLVAGSVLIIIAEWLFPLGTRKALAEEIKVRCGGENNISKSAYEYLYEREFKLTGQVKSVKIEKLFNIIATVLLVIDYLFYILAAVIAVALAGAITIIAGGICYLAYIIFGAGRANGAAEAVLRLAKATVIPTKWAFKLLGYVLSFKVFRVKEDSYEAMEKFATTDTSTIKSKYSTKEDPAQMSRDLSELQIDSYLSLDSLLLPTYCSWEGGRVRLLEASFSNVYVEGTLLAKKFLYKSQPDLDKLVREVETKIKSILEGQINKFLQDYPNAKRATINLKIEGRIVD